MSSIITLVRSGIDDDEIPYTYSPSQVVVFIERALKKLARKVGLELTIDAEGNITPAPSDDEIDLILSVTECIVAKRRAKDAAKGAIRVKQDENTIDKTGIAVNFAKLATEICSQAEDVVNDYLKTGANTGGDIIWSGSERLYEDTDFDGTGSSTLDNVNYDIDGKNGLTGR